MLSKCQMQNIFQVLLTPLRSGRAACRRRSAHKCPACRSAKNTDSGIRRHAGLAHQPLAEGAVLLVVSGCADAGGEKIGAFATAAPRSRSAPAPPPAYRDCPAAARVSARGKSISCVRPWATPSCSAGGVVKVRNWCALADHLDQRARSRHPAHLPAGEGENLSRRTDPHRALAHARQGRQRNMRAAVKDQMLIDLVADHHRADLATGARQHFQFAAVEHPPHRIERRIDHHDAGVRRDRLRPAPPRSAASPAAPASRVRTDGARRFRRWGDRNRRSARSARFRRPRPVRPMMAAVSASVPPEVTSTSPSGS